MSSIPRTTKKIEEKMVNFLMYILPIFFEKGR
jgi:hypothetical protein